MNPVPKPERKHKPRQYLKATIPERELQGMAEELCQTLGIRFFRIPDKLLAYLRTYAPTWTRVFVYRYLSGLPDMMLFRALSNGRNEVLFLEIKTEAGELSLNQKKWHSGLNVKVAYGWDEVKRTISEFYLEEKNG